MQAYPFLRVFLCLICLVGFNACYALDEDASDSPAMGDSLRFSNLANTIEIPKIDPISYSVVASALGMAQSNPSDGNSQNLVDVSNAQLILQKNSGLVQFYLQAGYYSIPSLGTSYQRSNRQTIDSFGLVPLAYISIPVGENLKISAGKLNSFGGYESTFTFQNINIDRGLLWNQTSNVSKGVAATYAAGAVSAAFTLNDGFYSNQLNWMGASASYQHSEQSKTSLSWTGAIKSSTTESFITPLAQNNSQILNAIYSHKTDRWFFAPNLQYTFVPANPAIGILSSAQTMGAALLANYQFFDPELSGGKMSLPFRMEYISSNGKGNPNSPNLLYGVGSSAWSATITPTYQFRQYFFRAEFSYVQAINTTAGLGFGQQGTANNQSRLMFETGILY